MRVFAPAVLLAAAPLAWAAPNVAAAVERAVALVARQNNASSSDTGAYNISAIPAQCDQPCTVYKDIFGTCPSDPSASVCAQACNQTYHNEFNVCIGCVNNNGPAAGVMQHDIDLLNVAQQQLVQQCIDMGSPATFTGTVVLPKSVAYPSGVVNATYAQNSTTAPATSTPATTPTNTATTTSNGTATGPATTSPTSGAQSFQPALVAVVVAAMGVASLC